MAEQIKISPCPFCGGRAELFRAHYQVCVNCISCDADGPSCIAGLTDAAVEERAITAWNRGYAFVEGCKMAVDNYYSGEGDEQSVAQACKRALANLKEMTA